MTKRYAVATIVGCACAVSVTAQASQLDGALDAMISGEQYLDISLVPLYQNALDAGADTGNYTLDAIGKFTLRSPGGRSSLGNTDLVFWVNSSGKLAGLDTTSMLAMNAGLLWDTNDIDVDGSNTSFLVLGLDQWFLDDTLSVGFGKFFPGQMMLSSAYTADNSNAFTSKMISGNPVVSWWEALGIGVNVGYFGDNWFVQAAVVDSKGETEFDLGSFADGKWSYLLEATYQPDNDNGETSIGAVGYYTSARNQRSSESGIVAQFTHEWGDDARFAAFGRWSYREGGESQDLSNPGLETPVKRGGFVGMAWNRPFDRAGHQVAVAAIYGEPSEYKVAAGFEDQYGVEFFWNWQARPWMKVLPSLQLMKNIDDDVEPIIGIRVNMGFNRSWVASSIGEL